MHVENNVLHCNTIFQDECLFSIILAEENTLFITELENDI